MLASASAGSRVWASAGVARGMRFHAVLILAVLLGGCQSMKSSKEWQSAGTPTIDLVQMDKDASSAYAAQDWPTSERLYVELTKQNPSATEPWFRLGNIYARTDRVELAVRAYRETVIRDAKHARAWHNMGIVQLRQSAASFGELGKYGAPDDPLVQRGADLGHQIEQLLSPAKDDATH